MTAKNSDDKTGKGLVFAGLGMEIIGMMIGSVIIGQEIDKLIGWKGYYSVIVLMLASFGVWVWHIIVIARKFMQDTENQ